MRLESRCQNTRFCRVCATSTYTGCALTKRQTSVCYRYLYFEFGCDRRCWLRSEFDVASPIPLSIQMTNTRRASASSNVFELTLRRKILCFFFTVFSFCPNGNADGSAGNGWFWLECVLCAYVRPLPSTSSSRFHLGMMSVRTQHILLYYRNW